MIYSKKELGTIVNVSVKRVSKYKLQQEAEDNIVSGWKLKHQNANMAILTKSGGLSPGLVIY